jgi:hypothetical protein
MLKDSQPVRQTEAMKELDAGHSANEQMFERWEMDEIQRLASTVAPVTCLAPAGGVVAMRPLVVNASSKARGDQPRRVLHIEYAASVHLGLGLELAVG